MRDCGFFDIGCHFVNLGLGWWNSLEWWTQALIVIGLLFLAYAAVMTVYRETKRFVDWFYRFGGWPAVVGVVLVAVAVLASIFSFGRKGTAATPVPGKKATPAPKAPRKSGKRRYNLDTNEWEDR